MIQTGRYPHTATYVSSGNIPSRSANSIQVMKMGQALSRLIKDFNIVTTLDYRTFLAREEFNFSKWYGVDSSIPVVRVPMRLTAKYPLPKGDSHPLFLPAAMAYLLWRRPDFVYTRRSEIARWTIRLGIPVLLESHDPVDSDSSWLIAAAANDLLLGLVTISPILSDTYIRFGIPERMVLSEADGVDIERFGDNLSKVAARMKLFSEGLVPNGNPTSKIVMYAGNLDQDRRIEDLFYCAKKLGRQISLVGRSMNRIYKAAKQCGYLKDVIEPIDSREAKNFSREKIIYLCTGSQGEPMGLSLIHI